MYSSFIGCVGVVVGVLSNINNFDRRKAIILYLINWKKRPFGRRLMRSPMFIKSFLL